MDQFSYWKRACTIILLCAGAISSPAQTFTTLVNFIGTNGGYPSHGSLVQSSDGNFYGTTQVGGPNGFGTVFKMTPGGTLTTLYSFGAANDGGAPATGLIQATDGNFYGTTYSGGKMTKGTVFKITPGGTLTTLYSFAGTDGGQPLGLIQAADGNLYGTTEAGGTAGSYGTVFKITLGGVLTTLYSFSGGTDGFTPTSGLIQATDGNLYGTTSELVRNGYGTVFKITPGGALTTLHTFGGSDGDQPQAGLVQATDENFYGTTFSGGGAGGYGTVFKMTPGGTLTTVYSFDGTDNSSPDAGLIQATDGNFYGTTSGGGPNGTGTVFKITPGGALTTLHTFGGGDGANPQAGLVQGVDGNLYGTTQNGGTYDGTVFKLQTMLPTGPQAPAITLVQNAEGGSATIAPNTWVSINGSNLAPAGDTRIWQGSDFVSGQMPAQLDGVGVTMNGENAYVYYISPTQINVLTPPDLAPGPVQVKVTTGGVTSAAFTAQAQAESPSFFIFGAGPYIVGTHQNGTDLGPASLYPGLTTPAHPNEIVTLYANGFGPISPPVVAGSSVQAGSLPVLPVIRIGGIQATVQFAGLVSPGLYQFNVVVPASAPSGDNAITATYNGFTTQAGALLTVGP